MSRRFHGAKSFAEKIGQGNWQPFGMAGLWERWRNGDEDVLTCALITTDANDTVSPVHDRMPVILPPSDFDLWLGPAPPELGQLQALLRPYAPEAMAATPVGFHVNNARFDDPMCIQPVQPQGKA